MLMLTHALSDFGPKWKQVMVQCQPDCLVFSPSIARVRILWNTLTWLLHHGIFLMFKPMAMSSLLYAHIFSCITIRIDVSTAISGSPKNVLFLLTLYYRLNVWIFITSGDVWVNTWAYLKTRNLPVLRGLKHLEAPSHASWQMYEPFPLGCMHLGNRGGF